MSETKTNVEELDYTKGAAEYTTGVILDAISNLGNAYQVLVDNQSATLTIVCQLDADKNFVVNQDLLEEIEYLFPGWKLVRKED